MWRSQAMLVFPGKYAEAHFKTQISTVNVYLNVYSKWFWKYDGLSFF